MGWFLFFVQDPEPRVIHCDTSARSFAIATDLAFVFEFAYDFAYDFAFDFGFASAYDFAEFASVVASAVDDFEVLDSNFPLLNGFRNFIFQRIS